MGNWVCLSMLKFQLFVSNLNNVSSLIYVIKIKYRSDIIYSRYWIDREQFTEKGSQWGMGGTKQYIDC